MAVVLSLALGACMLTACSKNPATVEGGTNANGGNETDVTQPVGEYTITFDANGGTFGSSSKFTATTTNGKLGSSSVPQNPTYTGYEFEKWTDATSGKVFSLSTTYTANTTFKAQWKGDGPITGDDDDDDDNNQTGDDDDDDDQGGGEVVLDSNSAKITFTDGYLIFRFVGPSGWESWATSKAHVYIFGKSEMGGTWPGVTLDGGEHSASGNIADISFIIVSFEGNDGPKQTPDVDNYTYQANGDYTISYTDWIPGEENYGKFNVSIA